MRGRGPTCRCWLCGRKQANVTRNDYIRSGIRISEDGPNHQHETRRQQKHRRRQFEKKETLALLS